MVYKSKKTWKDLVEPSHHIGLTRRDFLARGLATGSISLGVSNLLMGDLVKKAFAQDDCPPAPTGQPGCIAQIYSQGGPTMGARFISKIQADMVASTPAIAANYGVSGVAGNIVRLGGMDSNLYIDSTSPFGATLLRGPNGYPGGQAAWQSEVLSKVSAGGHLGPFNADDGAGANLGLIGGVSPFKTSQIGKDLDIGVVNQKATWSAGLPNAAIAIGGLAPASFSNVFTMTPPAAGRVTRNTLTYASNASNSLATALNSIFNTNTRKGAAQMKSAVSCGIYGNAAYADPNYGAQLFNPAGFTELTQTVTLNQISAKEQAWLAAFYQSAKGVAGAVSTQLNGRDYHAQSAQVIAEADIEEARIVVMFLAACKAAQQKGAMMYYSNGQAIASGVTSFNATIGGAAVTVNAPRAAGDAGGAYNAGLILFYDPKGEVPIAKYTGTVKSDSGNAITDSNVGTAQEGVAGLYLSALKFINNGSVPQAALTAMRTAGVAASPTKITVF